MTEILRVKTDEIIADPNQPRKQFPEAEQAPLRESIRQHGMKTPPRVRRDEGRKRYILVGGERRFRAAVELGLTEIDCILVQGELTEADVLEDQIIDNEQRAHLRPLELGRALCRLQDLRGGTLASIAESLHLSAATVTRATSMLLLPPKAQEMVDDGRLNGRAAYAISRLSDPLTQMELAELAASGKLTCTQTEEEVQKRIGKRQSKPKQARLAVKEGAFSLMLAGPDKAAMEDMLGLLLKKLRGELRNGG
jgi:ParB family chromosome partitioning protein